MSGHLLQGQLSQNSILVEGARPLGSYVDPWDARHQQSMESNSDDTKHVSNKKLEPKVRDVLIMTISLLIKEELTIAIN